MAFLRPKRKKVRNLKINKVDDKPMVIHTKEKTKLNIHEAKSTGIKGHNDYSVNGSPKIKDACVNTADQGKKTYRKATIHQTKADRNSRIHKYRQNIKNANKSIKSKTSSIKVAGAVGANVTVSQMEGGDEVRDAAMVAYGACRPVVGTASRGAQLFRQKAITDKKRKIKKIDTGKKLAKKTAKNAAKNTSKKVAKETAKETAKVTAKTTAKIATTTAVTAAGTAVAPGVGTAIGIAAGYAAGVAVEAKDAQITNRNRKIKFFLDKMKAQENQQDSLAKLAKDLITRKALLWLKTVAPIIGLALLLLVLVVAMIAVPVIAVVAILYNSPFALFLPPLESGDTVQTVTSGYVSEFNRDVNTLANDHTGYDEGEIVFVDYEGTETNPSNYYDIMCVYMVKHGVGDTATVMNDTSKEWLQDVFDDMCSYTTSSRTETVVNDDGTSSSKTILSVNVSLKTYRDMITEYSFNSDQIELLNEMMSPENLSMIGYSGGAGGGGSGNSTSSMTQEEINAILSGISDSIQKSVISFALAKVGYPYSQDLRDSGDYYDCSSLAYYSWKAAGIDISYGGATTAAAEAQGLEEAGKTVTEEELQPGDLIFYSYTNNGRYKNISHVGIYVGNGKMVEAKNESAGVVYGDFHKGSAVLYARPNK